MGVLYQILGTFMISTMGVNMGVVFAWPAFTITLFQSQNTTLSRPMTDTEISLLGSLSSIGALISTPTAGYMLEKLGRKYCSVMNSLGLLLVWVILACTKNVETVLAAVFLSGIASSVFLVATVYISEICQDSIRGSMTACNMISYGLGMLLSYLLGGILEYHVMLYVGVTMGALGTCLLFVLKETPIHLMSKGKEKEAAESLAFYRMWKLDSKELLEEINNMKRALNPDLSDDTPEEEKLQPEMKSAEKLSLWQFIKKSKSSRRAFFVSLVVMTAAIFQGLIVVQMYAEPLFVEAVPTASPSLCSVMLAVATVVAGIVAAYLTDRLGRRPLMIYASLGSGISCVLLGTQMQFHWGPSWVAAVFMYLFAIMYTCGAGTVPFVLLAELFLPEVKSLFSMVLVEYVWLCNFVILFIFNPLLKAVGWGPVFYIFAIICFLSSSFCVFFLPETKGLDVEAIQVLFTSKRKSRSVRSVC
ncbi:facilitated trehalose transporter Tret1-like [Helicoverpa zea]|uniref:facilitated trehalose transporter Tret1-like n=1 Tax=Helicoverpa zea TaxID=7113 RepID=UPI001F577E08|nr:facilitated trehalose transporter Tret1-like [Helicoverpa zea]